MRGPRHSDEMWSQREAMGQGSAMTESEADDFAAIFQPSWHSSIPPRDPSAAPVVPPESARRHASGVAPARSGRFREDASGGAFPGAGTASDLGRADLHLDRDQTDDEAEVSLRFAGDKRRGRVGMLVLAVGLVGGIGYATMTPSSPLTRLADKVGLGRGTLAATGTPEAAGASDATGEVPAAIATSNAATATAAMAVPEAAAAGRATKVAVAAAAPAEPSSAAQTRGDQAAADQAAANQAAADQAAADQAAADQAAANQAALARSQPRSEEPKLEPVAMTGKRPQAPTAAAVAAPDPMDALPEPRVDSPPTEVQLKISVQPSHADLRVDGRAVSHPFRTTRAGGGVVKVRASATGFESRAFTLALDRDRTLAIALRPGTP